LSVPKLLLGALLVCVLVTITGIANPGSAHAATTCTKFASPSGSDSGAGTEASPFRSPQKLVDALGAGDTGCLRDGTYSISSVRFPRAGNSNARITLTSYPGEHAKLVDGFLYVPAGSDFVTISNLAIDATKASENAVQIHAADTVFEGNDLANRTSAVRFPHLQSCIHMGSNAGYGQAVRTIVRNNRIHDCGDPANGNKDHAIYFENTVGAQVVDNLFWNTAAYTIHLYPNAQGTRVAHNVIDGSGQSGVIFAGEGSLASSNNVVEQNIVANSRQYAVTSYWGGSTGGGNVARTNCVAGAGSGVIGQSTGFATSGNATADPMFVNAGAHDYRLRPGSGCLGVVGYDTAAKIAGADTPAPAAAPAAANGAAPVPTSGKAHHKRHHKRRHKHTHKHSHKHGHHKHSHKHTHKHHHKHSHRHHHKHGHKHHHKHHHAPRHHRR
jgi:hypothetical protein